MVKKIKLLVLMIFIISLTLNCPKESKKDDSAALLILLAANSSGTGCNVTISGSSDNFALTHATSVVQTINRTESSSGALWVVSAKGLSANSKVVFTDDPGSVNVYKQSDCPIVFGQNSAFQGINYQLVTNSSTQTYTIITPGDYLFIGVSSTGKIPKVQIQ
ncbi:hypothetical protein [Leptospira kanakyensis]|uniref:hypothetical protein n=1 Tax=Leptospira kanakyensis TaxID=2484968 RepID=UPI00223C9BC9|nr:hypothetical protein [Leptospira kanakyensis]MCW7482852.1 hypothetical protein [Leptospira kanakyensis]